MRILCEQTQSARRARGFTVPEMLTASSVFIFMVVGLISTNMFALRQDQLVNSKLGANDQSRLGFDLLLGELRACKDVQVGNGNATNFVTVTNGALQQGNALQIIPSTNTSIWIRYYFNTNNSNGELRRVASFNTNSIRICTGLTNTLIFQVADYTGTNLLTTNPTNYNYNYVVSAVFQFYQYQYPLTYVGSNQYYNYYKIAFKAARRAP